MEYSDRIIMEPEKRVGRPPGAKNKSTLFKEIIAKNVDDVAAKEFGKVVEKAFELAQAGDQVMIKMLFDKFYASQKAIDGEAGGIPVVNITIQGINPEKLVIDGESSGES